MKKCLFVLAISLLGLVAASQPAHADGSAPAGHVVNLQLTNFPSWFVFYTDAMSGTGCSNFVYTNSNVDNMKAAYATLLAAWVSQRPLGVHYTGSGSCTVTLLFVTN